MTIAPCPLAWRTMLVCLAGAATLGAQEPAAVRPDTLGANVPQDQRRLAMPDAFDFLVGEWTFTFQQRRPDGAWGTPTPGTWSARKTHDGLVVEDVWTLGETTDPTLSWRVYNPSRGIWEMQGLKARRGSFDPGIAWGRGTERFVEQTFGGGSTHARIRYYDITPTGFLWRADVSIDGGKTWTRDFWVMQARRAK